MKTELRFKSLTLLLSSLGITLKGLVKLGCSLEDFDNRQNYITHIKLKVRSYFVVRHKISSLESVRDIVTWW